MSTAEPTTTQPTSQDTSAIKTRIINHMNADHQDSLVRFLEHYAHLPSYRARNARLLDLSLAWMLLSTSASHSHTSSSSSSKPDSTSNSASGKPLATDPSVTHIIPLDPPLESYTTFRQRLVDMDKVCVAALNRSPITVKEYAPAKGFNLAVAVTCLVTFAVFGWRGNLEGRGWVGGALGLRERFPAAFAWLWRIQPWVFWPMLTAHLAEAYHMDRTRLQPHSVPRLSSLWWKWVVSTFIEGFHNFWRFDAIVERERRRKEKAKH